MKLLVIFMRIRKIFLEEYKSFFKFGARKVNFQFFFLERYNRYFKVVIFYIFQAWAENWSK